MENYKNLLQRKQSAPVYGLVLLFLLLATIVTGYRAIVFQHEATRALGRVVSIDERVVDGKVLCEPIVEFATTEGLPIRFTSATGGICPPLYAVQEPVAVLYLKTSPQDTAAIDRGLWNWRGTLLFLSAFVFLLAGNIFRISAGRRSKVGS